MTLLSSHTLAGTAWPSATQSLLRAVLLAFAGTLLLTVSAKIQVPFYPVPMTMQTFAVLVIGMSFGWRLGGLTILAYLAEGALGLPVFAGTPERGIGLAYMAGPTGGFLAGFFVSAVLVGWLAKKGWDKSTLMTLVAMTLGTAIIFLMGFGWLSTLIGPAKAFAFGVQPFLLGAAFKIALAALLLPLTWKLVSRLKG